MIDERIEDLMWQKIDGSISEKDQADLDAHLNEHPTDKAHFDELASMSTLLDSADDVEPPTDLRQRIESAVDWDIYPQEHATSFDWRAFFTPWWNLRIAAAAAIGIILGIIVYPTIIYKLDPSLALVKDGLGGTMVSSNASTLVLESDGIAGEVTLRRGQDTAITDMQITSDREIEIALEYAGISTLLRAQVDQNTPLGNILVDGSTVRVTHNGSGRYYAVFSPVASSDVPLRVRIYADGKVLLEEQILPEK